MAREMTITLDDDVAAKLEVESTRVQRPFEEVVNEAIRRGLEDGTPGPIEKKPFKIRARSMGFKPGLDLNCTSRLLDQIDNLEWEEKQKRLPDVEGSKPCPK